MVLKSVYLNFEKNCMSLREMLDLRRKITKLKDLKKLALSFHETSATNRSWVELVILIRQLNDLNELSISISRVSIEGHIVRRLTKSLAHLRGLQTFNLNLVLKKFDVK